MMEWHDNMVFLLALAVNMLTIGAMWGTLQYKVRAMSESVEDLNKSIHNGITSRQIKMETTVESISTKVDALAGLPERLTRIETKCETYHGTGKDSAPDPKA